MSDPSSTRSIAELTRRYFEACNERRIDDLDHYFRPEFVSHLRVGDVAGLDRFKAMLLHTYDAFPDVWWTPVETIEAPDRCTIRYYFEGTHLGHFMGVPPSHRRVHIDACEVMHIRDGWVLEIWNYADMLGMAAQLNADNPLALRA
jgi:predicted ester cyclase